jgi:predicted acylesterase/phospholipase RssA
MEVSPNQIIRRIIDPIINEPKHEVTTEVLKAIIDNLKDPKIVDDNTLYNDLRVFRKFTKNSDNSEILTLGSELKELIKTKQASQAKSSVDTKNEIPGQKELKEAISKHKPINLVFEGGGAKGILFYGILEKLEQDGTLANIRNVAGSSAGGMVAFLVAIGFTPLEIFKHISGLDFVKLQDQKPIAKVIDTTAKAAGFVMQMGVLKFVTNSSVPVAAGLQLVSQVNPSSSPVSPGEVFGLLNNNYLYEGEELLKLAIELLAEKGLDPNITFEEHHNLLMEARRKKAAGEELDEKLQTALLFKDLFLTGTRIDGNKSSTFTFGHKYCPKVRLIDGFRATSSFPIAYKLYPIEIDGVTYYFSDGGIKRNYPMDIFDCSESDFLAEDASLVKVGPGRYGENKESYINPCTLGCKVDSSDECESLLYAQSALEKAGNSPNLVGVIKSLMVDSDSGVGTYYKYNTIQGLDLNLTTLNFALSPLEKLGLILSGKSSALEYDAQKRNGFPWKANVPLDEKGKKFAALAKDLITISDIIKKLETVTTETVWNSEKMILDLEFRIAKIIFDFQEDYPEHALEIGLATFKQINEMKWTSGTLSYDREKLWNNLIIKIQNACNDIAKTRLNADTDVVGEQKLGSGTLIGPAINFGLLTIGATLATAATLPITLPVGIGAFAFTAWKLRSVDRNQRFENPSITVFRQALSEKNYQSANEILEKNADKNILQLLSVELDSHKQSFWRTWPKELLELERNLLAKTSSFEEEKKNV